MWYFCLILKEIDYLTLQLLRTFPLLTIALMASATAFGGAVDPEHDALGARLQKDQLRIHPSATPGAFLAVNADRGYAAGINGTGFTFSGLSEEEPWCTRIDVMGIGRSTTSILPWEAATACPAVDELRFIGRSMDVQYVHDGAGLRQNFLVHDRPMGEAPLGVLLRYDGDHDAVSAGQHGIRFTDRQGATRFTYDGLKAWDACGNVLNTSMVVHPDGSRTIALVVDDRDAEYPITIDPVSTTANTLLVGPAIAGLFGQSVHTAGDLNGDGYSDVVVGAPNASMGENKEGVVYVYYGSSTGIPAVANVVLQSDQANANFGYSVSNAGDVNGDGFGDLVVGAQTWESSAADDLEGGVFVFHGSATGINTVPDYILQVNSTAVYLGMSVSCAGDINNDGYSDIVAGAPYAAFPSSLEGAAYVYLGGPTGLNPVPHKRLERNQGAAQFGLSCAGVGDVNGDGFSDIGIAAHRFDLNGTDDGIVCIYYGSAVGIAGGANPNPNVILENNGYTNTGWCVAAAGDVNGDGYSDVVVGDWRANIGANTNVGVAMIFHGSAAGLNPIPATILDGPAQTNAWFGRSVSTAGDVNGDGYGDLVVGAVTFTNGQTSEGAAYLYLGSPTGIPTTFFFRYELNLNGANMGESVCTAGDVNGDGFSDFIVGIKLYGNGGGATVYHGGPYNLAAGPSQVRNSGLAGARLGASVANAGDINGDGYSDVVVGAPDASNGQANEGLAYIHYGGPGGINVVPNLTLEMNVAGAHFGRSVSSAGDVNGDGYADVVVGAPDAGGTGRAYVYMGSPGGLGAVPSLVLNGAAASEYGFAVCTAGDVNSDGYADVVIGAPGIATAFVYLGATGGLNAAPHITSVGPAGSRYGAAVGTGGDVNGTGYSDVVIGAPLFTNGQANEGAAFVHYGSPLGLNAVPDTQLEQNIANAFFGTSVAGAGDVNGNGYYEIVVGAPGWAAGQANEGAAFLYYGSPAGISPVVFSTFQSNQVNAAMGTSVAEGGDLNGDGYADFLIGTPNFSNGQLDEGRVFVVQGSIGAFGAVSSVESNLTGALMGWSVAGGGDTDGDGYSDVLTGVPSASPMFANEGALYVYRGNQGLGIERRTRQYQADLVSPLSTNSIDFTTPYWFGIGHHARSPIQRTRSRLRWEVVREGQAFSGSPITNSMGFTTMSAFWTDIGVGGVEIKESVNKVPGYIRYKWRVRVEYAMNKLIDGQRFSRWFYGYASGLGDIGVLPIELLWFEGWPQDEGNRLEWSTGSEHQSDRFEVERSTNGVDFRRIGELPAAGESQTLTRYDLLDRNAPNGVSYYRLLMLDRDGEFAYSDIVAVDRNGGGPVVFPNPASDRIQWEQVEGTAEVRIHDALGKCVLTDLSSTEGVGSVSIANLPPGHYSITLLNDQGDAIMRSRFIRSQAPIVP